MTGNRLIQVVQRVSAISSIMASRLLASCPSLYVDMTRRGKIGVERRRLRIILAIDQYRVGADVP